MGLAQMPDPLAPLSAGEIEAVDGILRQAGKVKADTAYVQVGLHEPAKEAVINHKPGDAIPRQAFVVLFDRARGTTAEAVIDLTAKSVASYRDVPGVQPAVLMSELQSVARIVRADARWQAAMRKRGLSDFEAIQVDPWSPGITLSGEEENRRVVRAVSYLRGKAKNGYGRPIEGVVAYVDPVAKKVFQLVDTGVVAIPKDSAELDEASIGPQRKTLRPLQIQQPDGPSFEVKGNLVKWDRWQFRFSVDPREGLVLHTVSYDDNGKLRPILYRASLSEMYVPYGDPGKNWLFRNVFDQGEYGIGTLAFSLEPKTDAPSNAVFFDSVFAGEDGKPYVQPRTVALYERDGGLLWKHYDTESQESQSRRGRDLVLFSLSTVGNYDYGFGWIFRQDGSLELEAQLTGIMQARGVDATVSDPHDHTTEKHAHLVAPNVVAPHHQHFFNFRLDLDVDGAAGNRILELNTIPQPAGPSNASRTGMLMQHTLLRTESEAQRDVSLATSRKWKIESSTVKNSLGQHAGYLLVPGETAVPYAAPGSWYRRRAGFINHHLWVTPFEPAERNAAGAYPNQGKGGDGLPRWVKGNRPIDNTDVVVWYTFGVTHIPRPEEWPVMPVHRTGFKLLPVSFFSRSPALDVPRP
jgi:primary-amine oxidase